MWSYWQNIVKIGCSGGEIHNSNISIARPDANFDEGVFAAGCSERAIQTFGFTSSYLVKDTKERYNSAGDL